MSHHNSNVINTNNELVDYDPKYYKLRKAPGDGDCAYHSVIESIQSLYGDEIDITSNPTTLREQLIDYIKKDVDTLTAKKKRELIARIQSGVKNKGRGWAENEEFEMLARMFDVCIAVWSEVNSVWEYFYHKDIDIRLRGVDGCKKIIYLFNSTMKKSDDFDGINAINVYVESNQALGVHYDYLIPKTDEESDSDEEDSSSNSDEDFGITLDVDNADDEENSNTNINTYDTTTDDDDTEDDDDNMMDDFYDEDTVEKKDADEQKRIEKMSPKDRFQYFKTQLEVMDNIKNYSDIQTIMRISDRIKPEMKSHRLLEHEEYLVEANKDVPVDGFSFTKNQKFLKKFMSMDTTNVGILLFHGVGVGKTCSSILVAENFVNVFDKKVLVLLPSSLESNYRKELFDVTKLNYETETYESCNGKKYLDEIPNWSKMSKMELDRKIQKMISEEYSFYGYLKLVNFVEKKRKDARKIYGKEKENERNMYLYMKLREYFSNRVIIIDEVHNVRLSNDKSMKKFPKVLKLILRCAENVRLVLLSATPMFDNPDEISWIMDFMYMVDRRYLSYDTDIDFDKSGKLSKASEKRIKYFAKHYVSYMRGYNPDTFPIKYYVSDTTIKHPTKDMLTKDKIEKIDSKEYQFEYSVMKGNQLRMYKMNKESDTDKDIQNRIQLSNIVYPSEDDDLKASKGKRGFLNNFEEQSGKMLKVSYADNATPFLRYEILEEHSSKIHKILTHIRASNGSILIYSKYLFSGIIPCAIALEHMGYHKYNNNNILKHKSRDKVPEKKGSYIILTAEDSVSPNNADELMKFNDESNMNGEQIKIALINDIAAEGVTFKNVREIHIMEPWYNINKIEQIVGRGVRFYSHHSLPEDQRNIGIFLHANVDNSDVETVDYRRYRMSLGKQERIGFVEKLMKENAIDCKVNNISSLKIDKQIIDSKGKQKKINYQYDNIKCSQTDLKIQSGKPMNMRMLLFDIIEISKQIRKIIETKSLYHFSMEDMAHHYDNRLLKSTLEYMCKIKIPFKIKGIKGYLIKKKSTYFFQQREIDDIKINLVDRKQKRVEFVNHYKVEPKHAAVKNENKLGNTEEGLLKEFDATSNMIRRVFGEVSEQHVYDMVVDRIGYENVKQIPYITHEELLKSLERGLFVIRKEGKLIAYYNMYENVYMCDKNGSYVLCDLRKNDQLKNQEKKNIPKREMEGFIDIIEKSSKKKYELKSKILHLDNSYDRSFGSACISTSTIRVKMLKDKIKEYEEEANMSNTDKKSLCLIYEYVLRKYDKFVRPTEYQLNKN
jgi:hypothetical protein